MDWLPKDTMSRWILAAFAVVIVALTLSLGLIGRENQRREAASSEDVLSLQSSRPLDDLRSCLGRHLAMEHGRGRHWTGSPRDAGGLRAFNPVTDVGVRLYDLGDFRKVVVSTRRSRPLRLKQRSTIDSCVR